jgi:amidase
VEAHVQDEELPPHRLSAVEAVERLREGRLSARAMVESCLEQIGRHDGWVRAFVTVCGERALAEADAADRERRDGRLRGPLHGLPVAVKDLTATAGVRTTFGSRIYAEHIPAADDLCVERLRRAGAIILGKTNTPEFGFGPRSTNFLFGPTATPYDPERSSGGSSGGSAAAVAAGMVPLAHGTDFGGSVRTPASFCGVVGLRPTPGRIPSVPKALAWDTMATHGVLARSVEDAALMLGVMAGRDDRDPVSALGGWAAPDGAAPAGPPRLAFSTDLGVARISREVGAPFGEAVRAIAARFPQVDEDAPDCAGAQAAFETLRAAIVRHVHRHHWERHRDQLTGPARWNIERGEDISAAEFLRAEQERSRVYGNFVEFFRRYDFLLTPAASVLPFPNAQAEVLEIDGHPLRNPIDYLTITYVVSLMGMPCLSIPCAWTKDGLPVGMQIIGPPFAEGRLLRFAMTLQEEMAFRFRWPAPTA